MNISDFEQMEFISLSLYFINLLVPCSPPTFSVFLFLFMFCFPHFHQNLMLDKFSEAIRGNLTKLDRLKLVALVTIEVSE